jgi:hypothetical protein
MEQSIVRNVFHRFRIIVLINETVVEAVIPAISPIETVTSQ